jgi:hypothetical protein
MVASRAAMKPRGGGAACARRSISAGGMAAFAAAISARLLASIRVRMSLMALSVGNRHEDVEAVARLAGVDDLRCEARPFGEIGGAAGDQQSRAGIE